MNIETQFELFLDLLFDDPDSPEYEQSLSDWLDAQDNPDAILDEFWTAANSHIPPEGVSSQT